MTATEESSRLPDHGYTALRRYRWSTEGTSYFLTFNAERPTNRLCTLGLRERFIAERDRLGTEGAWQVRTRVVMPDHVHALVRLGATASLSECLRLFKERITPALRPHALHWQDGSHDHQMRDGEDALPVFLYIFLNPYRAELLRREEKWPGYFCAADDWAWFGELTYSETPGPEWLR